MPAAVSSSSATWGGAVAEGDQAAARVAQGADAVWHVGVDGEMAEAIHNVVDGCRQVPVQVNTVQDSAQGADPELGEGA